MTPATPPAGSHSSFRPLASSESVGSAPERVCLSGSSGSSAGSRPFVETSEPRPASARSVSSRAGVPGGINSAPPQAVVSHPGEAGGQKWVLVRSRKQKQLDKQMEKHSAAGIQGQVHALRRPTFGPRQPRCAPTTGFNAPMARPASKVDLSGRCYRCLSPFHFRSQCNQPIRCHHCYIAGHIAKECRSGELPQKAFLPPNNTRRAPPPSLRSPLIKQKPPASSRLSAHARVIYPLTYANSSATTAIPTSSATASAPPSTAAAPSFQGRLLFPGSGSPPPPSPTPQPLRETPEPLQLSMDAEPHRLDISVLPVAHPYAPGGAMRRVDRTQVFINNSAEMAEDERLLMAHAAIVIVPGSDPNIWPAQIVMAIESDMPQVPEGVISVNLLCRDAYLVRFSSARWRAELEVNRTIHWHGTPLVLRQWSRRFLTEMVTYRYRVRLFIEGIPPNAANCTNVIRALPTCRCHTVAIPSAEKTDYSYFVIYAWVHDPDSIPKFIDLDAMEDDPALPVDGQVLPAGFEQIIDDVPWEELDFPPPRALRSKVLVHLDSLILYPSGGPAGPSGGAGGDGHPHRRRYDWAWGRIDGEDAVTRSFRNSGESVFRRLGGGGGDRRRRRRCASLPPASRVGLDEDCHDALTMPITTLLMPPCLEAPPPTLLTVGDSVADGDGGRHVILLEPTSVMVGQEAPPLLRPAPTHDLCNLNLSDAHDDSEASPVGELRGLPLQDGHADLPPLQVQATLQPVPVPELQLAASGAGAEALTMDAPVLGEHGLIPSPASAPEVGPGPQLLGLTVAAPDMTAPSPLATALAGPDTGPGPVGLASFLNNVSSGIDQGLLRSPPPAPTAARPPKAAKASKKKEAAMAATTTTVARRSARLALKPDEGSVMTMAQRNVCRKLGEEFDEPEPDPAAMFARYVGYFAAPLTELQIKALTDLILNFTARLAGGGGAIV